jgi:ankyrin repeat protein
MRPEQNKEAMSWAAAYGHLQVVKFLHEKGSVGGKDLMNKAASGGHLEIVRFLHNNRTEGCTNWAMTDAASNGHLDVVRFLIEHSHVFS